MTTDPKTGQLAIKLFIQSLINIISKADSLIFNLSVPKNFFIFKALISKR